MVAQGADNKTVEAAALAEEGVMRALAGGRAQESDRGAQPHCEYRRMIAAGLARRCSHCRRLRARWRPAAFLRFMAAASWRPAGHSIYVEPVAERDGYELRNTLIDLLGSDGAQAARPIVCS